MTARRLLLRLDELAALCADLVIELPAAFIPVPTADELTVAAALEVARVRLTERGISGEAYDAVAANLRLFAAARVVVTVGVAVDDESRTALVALADHAGATLVHAHRGAVELSLWDIANVAIELDRIVPAATPSTSTATHTIKVHALLAALSLNTEGHHDVAVHTLRRDGLSLTEADDILDLAMSAHGSVHCVVTGRDPGRPGDVAVAHVVWILTAAGWLGLRGQTDGVMTTTPVTPADLSAFVAPSIAELIS